MSYYHYTSLDALNGILQPKEFGKKELCFWATRYDCFEDEEEYRLGIDCIGSCLSDFEERNHFSKDRRIAFSFKRELIEGNNNLPFPYVISFTSRKDNEYMWENYADHKNGVVIEIKMPQIIDNLLYRLEECIYVKSAKDEKLSEFIDSMYKNAVWELLLGGKERSLALLKVCPQMFLQCIAMYLLSFLAPRIKRNDFYKEEEIRIILSTPPKEYASFIYNNQVQIQNIINTLHLNLDVNDLFNMISRENIRLRNNKECYYRKLYLPEESLVQIFVLNNDSKIKVESILQQKGFNNVKVKIQC